MPAGMKHGDACRLEHAQVARGHRQDGRDVHGKQNSCRGPEAGLVTQTQRHQQDVAA